MTDNLSIFPESLPRGQNGSTKNDNFWSMNRLPVACSTASISDNDLHPTTMIYIRRVMLNVCELLPYKKTGKLGSSSKLEKYQNCQIVRKYECTYPGCEREYDGSTKII